jgi:F-type H+-transporting ATPase subunit delta
MRGTSELSRDAALRAFDPVAAAAGPDAVGLAREIFFVVDTLDSSGSLRRALTDPARPGTAKGTLVNDVFSELDARARKVVSDFASRRWTDDHELADALEDAGVATLLASAETAGSLSDVVGELFWVERTLLDEREVYGALDNRAAIPQAKVNLARTLLEPHLSPAVWTMIERACRSPRGRRLSAMVEYYLTAAAARRHRLVARVSVATELSTEQEDRLMDVLRRQYGRDVQVDVTIDRTVVGGVKIQVADDVVDGTILARLDEVRRSLVG